MAGEQLKTMLNESQPSECFLPSLSPDKGQETFSAKTIPGATESERVAAACHDVMSYILSSNVGQSKESTLKGDIKST